MCKASAPSFGLSPPTTRSFRSDLDRDVAQSDRDPVFYLRGNAKLNVGAGRSQVQVLPSRPLPFTAAFSGCVLDGVSQVELLAALNDPWREARLGDAAQLLLRGAAAVLGVRGASEPAATGRAGLT